MNSYDVRVARRSALVTALVHIHKDTHLSSEDKGRLFGNILRDVAAKAYPNSNKWRNRFMDEVTEEFDVALKEVMPMCPICNMRGGQHKMDCPNQDYLTKTYEALRAKEERT